MNPYTYAESSKTWMSRIYAEFLAELGIREQRMPLPEKSMYFCFSIIPGNQPDVEKELKHGLSTLKEALKKDAVSIYPELIVYPSVDSTKPYYLFAFEVKYS